MQYLARSSPNPATLETQAYELYCSFRPSVADGRAGWGAKGVLDLARIERMAVDRATAASKKA